jgi:hypothetical protein
VPFRPLDLVTGMGKKSGSGMNNPIIFPKLRNNFWVKIIFMRIWEGKNSDPRYRMEKIRIRDP